MDKLQFKVSLQDHRGRRGCEGQRRSPFWLHHLAAAENDIGLLGCWSTPIDLPSWHPRPNMYSPPTPTQGPTTTKKRLLPSAYALQKTRRPSAPAQAHRGQNFHPLNLIQATRQDPRRGRRQSSLIRGTERSVPPHRHELDSWRQAIKYTEMREDE